MSVYSVPRMFIKRLLTSHSARRLSDATTTCQGSSRSQREKSQPHTAEATAGFREYTSINVSGGGSIGTARGSTHPAPHPGLSIRPSLASTGSQLSARPGSSNQPPLLPCPCPAGWRQRPLLPPCLSKAWLSFTGSHAYPSTSWRGHGSDMMSRRTEAHATHQKHMDWEQSRPDPSERPGRTEDGSQRPAHCHASGHPPYTFITAPPRQSLHGFHNWAPPYAVSRCPLILQTITSTLWQRPFPKDPPIHRNIYVRRQSCLLFLPPSTPA